MATADPRALVIFRGELKKFGHDSGNAALAPTHLPLGKLVTIIDTAVENNPFLLQCDRQTFWNSARTSLLIGLEPDGVTGQGYFIPFKRKVQFIPGYKGYITLAYNSGFTLEGHVVRAADEFDYEYGAHPVLKHKPAMGAGFGERNPIIAAYAVARAPGQEPMFRVMEMDEILAVRDSSQGYRYARENNKPSPWIDNFEAMALKSPVRWLGARLPLNVLRTAAAVEEIHERLGVLANVDRKGDTLVVRESVIDGESRELTPEEATKKANAPPTRKVVDQPEKQGYQVGRTETPPPAPPTVGIFDQPRRPASDEAAAEPPAAPVAIADLLPVRPHPQIKGSMDWDRWVREAELVLATAASPQEVEEWAARHLRALENLKRRNPQLRQRLDHTIVTAKQKLGDKNAS